jgi:hypothetical protein
VGFITQPGFDQGPFSAAAVHNITRGNGHKYSADTLHKLILILIDLEFEVHEFDSSRELFRWIADNC